MIFSFFCFLFLFCFKILKKNMNGQQNSSPAGTSQPLLGMSHHHHSSSHQHHNQNHNHHSSHARSHGHFNEAPTFNNHVDNRVSSCMITGGANVGGNIISGASKYLNTNAISGQNTSANNNNSSNSGMFGNDHSSIYNTSPVHPLYYGSQHHFNEYDMSNNYSSYNSYNNNNMSHDSSRINNNRSSQDIFTPSMRDFHQNRSYEHYMNTKNSLNNLSNQANEESSMNVMSGRNITTSCEPSSVASYSSNYSLEDDDDNVKSFAHPYGHQTRIPGSPPMGYNPTNMYNNCCVPLSMSGQNTVTQSPQSESDALYSPLNDSSMMQCNAVNNNTNVNASNNNMNTSSSNDKRVMFMPHTPPTTPASSSGCSQINPITKRNINNSNANANHNCSTPNVGSQQMSQQFDPKTGKLKVHKKRGRPRKCDKLNLLSSMISSNNLTNASAFKGKLQRSIFL